ncbi:uncharacterized protein LOC142765757 [Rhipicephalus microplus]|uniref:uncharacterized protein LOC142765757 n=1 Tax=Rhipicephalus microplus TaxID=6941 RepID=UPI003F6AB33F
MASNFNSSLLDLGQTSPHGYEGKPDMPSRRLPISAFQRLPPGRHVTQHGHNSNLSTDRNSTDAATPMRNLTVHKLTGQLLGDEQDSYATWDVAERDSDKSNESLLEQKAQAVPLLNDFKSNVPSGRPETLDTVATSLGLSTHTLKLAHHTANSRGYAITTRLPDNIANASYAPTASSVVKVRIPQQKLRELGMLTMQMDAKNGSKHLTAVTLQPVDGEAASIAATIDERNAEPPLVNVSYSLTPVSLLQPYANAETVSQSAWTQVSLIGGTTPRVTHDSTNEANDTETKQEVDVVRVQDDLIDIPEGRADADINDPPEDDLSVSTDIATTDKKAETHYIDAMTSASEAMTESGAGKVTETIEDAADSPPMPETVKDIRAITSDVGSTDATTAVATEDALSTQMPVTDETDGDVTGVISSEESHTQEASSSISEMSLSSEQLTDVISSQQSPTKEPSSSIPEMSVSSEQFTDVISSEQGPTKEPSSSMLETSVSNEQFTDVFSSEQGPTQEPSSTITEISVSSEEFTDVISSEQGLTQKPSSFIPEISVSSEEFTDVISSEKSHTKGALSSSPEISVSSEEFTDVVSSEQSHTEEVSSSIPEITGGSEEFTDVISSEESHTGEASTSVPEMSVSIEKFTDVITNEQGPTQKVSSSIPEMTGSSEEFTDAITSDESPTGEASSSIPEMSGSSEEFTDLIMSSMETAASSMLVTDTSSDSPTEEISSEQSTAEMDWSLIPDTSEINDIFTEVIPSEEYSTQMALVTIPFTSESDDAFTELIGSEQPSAENASVLETITSTHGETFTEAMSSQQPSGETVSVSIALTSRDGEALTDIVSTENAEDMISSVTLLTGEYNEEVSEVIGTDNSSSLAPTITGSDSITAFDLIDITLELDNATNASSTEMTNGSSAAESTAILVTTGATDNFTDKTQGVDTSSITASELITPVQLITFTEEFISTEEGAFQLQSAFCSTEVSRSRERSRSRGCSRHQRGPRGSTGSQSRSRSQFKAKLTWADNVRLGNSSSAEYTSGAGPESMPWPSFREKAQPKHNEYEERILAP